MLTILVDRLWTVPQAGSMSKDRQQFTAEVVISYAATDHRLTRASAGVAQLAAESGRANPPIFWGIFSAQSPRQKAMEREKKENIFRNRRNFFIGEMGTSIDEPMAVIKVAKENNISLERVLVYAWGPHSRRDRLAWKYCLRRYYSKTARVEFRSLSGPAGDDPENPMILQRNWKVWTAFNMVFYAPYRLPFGVQFFAWWNPRQPAS
jgi:hypothetical protein